MTKNKSVISDLDAQEKAIQQIEQSDLILSGHAMADSVKFVADLLQASHLTAQKIFGEQALPDLSFKVYQSIMDYHHQLMHFFQNYEDDQEEELCEDCENELAETDKNKNN